MRTNSVERICWSGNKGPKNALEQLEISGGNKGIVTFDARVKSADVDIHSSYGGVVESALGTSFKPYSLFVPQMAVSWLKVCTKKYKSRMNEN